MKRIIIALALLMTAGTLHPILRAAEIPAARAILYPVKSDPTVSFRIWFRVGSQDDPKGKEGLAALTASLMTDGATKNNRYETILERLYPMAANYDASVDKEMTVIYGRTHKDNVEPFYTLLKEAILEPAFDEADFSRIKSQTLSYIEKTLRYSSDEELGKAAFYDFIYAGTPYGHLNAGTAASVGSITLQDVRDFYRIHFTRDNLVIGLGGGYEPALAARMRKEFAALPAGTPERVAKPQPANIDGVRILLVDKKTEATAISFGFPINLLRGSKDFYALWIANSWLGEHRNSSSHLYQVIRDARGMNYGDYSYIEIFPNGGARTMPPVNVARRRQLFEVWIRPIPNATRFFALRAAMREVQKLVDFGLTQEQFNLTRKFLKNYCLHFAPTTMEQLGYRMDDAFYGIKGSHLKTFRAMMDKLTLADVNAAIKKHLQYRNVKIAMVTSGAEEFRKELVAGTPSPMKYANPKPEEVLKEDILIERHPIPVKAENITVVPVDGMFEK